MPKQHSQLLDPPDTQCPAGEPTVRLYRDPPGVLVVDDEHLVRILVQLGLERDGFEVWLAATGREAIALYRTHWEDIDVVLLDVGMPKMDGLETLNALRELDPDVRVCFMSGNTGIYEPDELIKHGAAHLIFKPFLVADLANILRQLVLENSNRNGDHAKGDALTVSSPRSFAFPENR